MDVIESIRTKRAVRRFADKPIPRETILTVLEAGRRSQSAKNTQPWQFVVIQDRATLKALSKTGDYASHLAGAAFAIAILGAHKGYWDAFDFGQTAAYMQLAAWSLGIGSCIAAIYDQDEAKAI